MDPSTKVATIANLNPLQLQMALPPDAAPQVRPGQSVFFSVGSPSGGRLRTTIVSVAPQVDVATGTVPALALVANPGQRFRDDTTVRVQVVVERRSNVPIVPKSVVLTDADTGKTSVVTVDENGVAHVAPVSVGLTEGKWAEITHGLAAGQRVATSGQYGLPDGTKVQAKSAALPVMPQPPKAQDVQPAVGAPGVQWSEPAASAPPSASAPASPPPGSAAHGP